MTFFFETLLGGLLAGTMYSLVAIGFVLIYKASGVFNFAQGAMLLFAALTFVSLHDQGVPFALALLLTVIVMSLGALLIERLVLRHLARNAFVLVLTTIGLQFGSMLGGSVVTEKLFAWPGVGSLLIDSVGLRDIPAVQGAILVIVLFFLLINTLVDLAYLVVDPRIRYR